MTLIFGILLLYCLVVVASATLYRYILHPYLKDESWKKTLRLYSIMYCVVGLFIYALYFIIGLINGS